MSRFSEIARDIESQFDPDYDIDPDSGAPSVRYIEHRLLELCETLDERLTALEGIAPTTDAKPQARRMIAEIHRLEMDVYHAKANLVETETEIEHLAADRDNLAAEVGRLTDEVRRLEAQALIAERQYQALLQVSDNRGAEVKRLTAERDGFESSYIGVARERNALAAQLDDLRNVSAGLRQVNTALRNDNARMTAELAALR